MRSYPFSSMHTTALLESGSEGVRVQNAVQLYAYPGVPGGTRSNVHLYEYRTGPCS